MSIQALSWSLKQKCDTPTTKLVLVILANYSDENNSCYPSEKHLASIVGVSDRTIRRCLSYLQNNNLIRIQNRLGTSNRYYMTMDTSDHTPLDTDSQGDRTQVSNNTKDKTKDNTSQLKIDKFNEFWKIYPRKVNKKQALKLFSKIKEKDYEKVLHAVKVFSAEQINTDEQYIPHASTWLNQERYEDYINKNIKNNKLNKLAG